MEYTPIANRLGLYSAAATAVLIVAYAVALILGLLSLPSPDEPVRDPFFTILEILILVLMPVMVVLMISIHAWAPSPVRILSFIAVVFMGLLCLVTCSVHFVLLTTGRQVGFAGQSWYPMFLEFRWPSVVYALDILGWDVFFPLSMLFAAPVFRGGRLKRWIRSLMLVSGVIAFAGLIGVAFQDMQLRNIGIFGYVGIFLIVSILLAVLFYREAPET